MLRRPAPHEGEGIVQTKPKGLDHLSRHLHQLASEAHASEANVLFNKLTRVAVNHDAKVLWNINR